MSHLFLLQEAVTGCHFGASLVVVVRASATTVVVHLEERELVSWVAESASEIFPSLSGSDVAISGFSFDLLLVFLVASSLVVVPGSK